MGKAVVGLCNYSGKDLVNVYNTYASTFTGKKQKNEPKMMVPIRVFIFLEGDLGGNFFDRKEALHAESRRREARGSYFSIALITTEKTSLCPF